MVLFRSGLLACLLASTSYAFAFKPTAQQRTGVSNRPAVNLSMSGGSTAIPDLKAPPAIYEGAVAAGAGEFGMELSFFSDRCWWILIIHWPPAFSLYHSQGRRSLGQNFQAWYCCWMSHWIWILPCYYRGWSLSHDRGGQPWPSKGS